MALPADFSKIFGSTATGGLTPIGDVNYAKGWEFVGSNPPTKNDFSYLQNLSDLKSQWLYSNKLQRANPFGDIKSDGAAAVKTALENLGLGDGSALPVGVPVPWPSATPPTGWIKCNGAPFSAAQYPELAKVYPALKLPDLRGEFIRGWDDGRGVDSGRAILTGQGQSVQEHTHDLSMAYSSDPDYMNRLGNTPNSDMIAIKYMVNAITFTGSGLVYLKQNGSTSVETRPRNIAFNYIVRAV